MKNNKTKIYPLLFILSGMIIHAHMDKIIKIEEHSLIGLPQKYTPNYVDTEKWIFRINDTELEFPRSFLWQKDKFKEHITKVHASWYHDFDIMPPYIVIEFRPVGQNFYYDFLFNLDTKEIICATIHIQLGEDLWISHDFKDYYPSEEASK